MLKTNDIQIEKIKLAATNISATLEDHEVQPEQYYFLKDRLTTYKFYINGEYSIKSELDYDESSKLLSIGINIIIPDHYIPEDTKKANEILMDPINTFQLFYDHKTKYTRETTKNVLIASFGYRKVKCGTFPLFRFYPDLSTVLMDYFLYN